MGSKLDAIHPVCLHAVEDEKGRIEVQLNEGLIHRRHLVLWLHHRVIDLLHENGMLDYLDEDLDDRLSLLCADITSDYIGALFEEGEEAVKQSNDEAEEAEQKAETGAQPKA